LAEVTGNIGFEETLWKAADKLRGSMDASEYKHVVLGLIFLKYISDKFETKYTELVAEGAGFEEELDEYLSENIFWVPKEARWSYIRDNAKSEKIGQIIDDAMILIEKENKTLKNVLEKRYARPEIDKRRLGELIDLISTIKLHTKEEKDLLGRVYEYFLGKFADAEGKGGGEFYTPTSVVKTLVEMIEPFKGRIYDP
jgi:type I restriction enzyme M protein